MSARDLKIKTGKVKRTYKELLSYKKEYTQQEAKIEAMRAEGKDEHDIRKQNEVLQETSVMIPETRNRLKAFVEELAEFTDSVTDDGLKETEDFKAAMATIEEARAALTS